LADGKGVIELVNEPPLRDRRDPEPTAMVAYFLNSDAKTPLDPAPTSVKFEAATGKRSAKPIVLKAVAKPEDPTGASRFVSPTGPHAVDALRGTLSATIGGEDVSVPIMSGR
jgi:hypothetical protein